MNTGDARAIKRKQVISLMNKTGITSAISSFQNILNVVWDNVFYTPKFDSHLKNRIRTCPGTISSIDTLYGVNELCEIEDFSDVYLLIRKIRDNLLLDLFLFEAQKSFENDPNNSFIGIDLNNVNEMVKALNDYHIKCIDMEITKEELKAINMWKDDELLMSKNRIKQEHFQYSKYLAYLQKNNEDFGECFDKFLKDRFDKMDLKLNDYAHSNGESLMINKQEPTKVLCDIKETLVDLEQLFIISLFFIDSTLFVSSDYMDYVECGMAPPEGSQYWVNGYIQDILIKINSDNTDLFTFLIDHNNNLMKINI